VTFENPDLVAEHHDSDVLVGLGSTGGSDDAEETAQTEVEERKGHGG
jgi:hypothetical protein